MEIDAECDSDGDLAYTSHVSLPELAKKQQEDPELASIFLYLQNGVLPENEVAACRLVLERSRYSIVDGILHYENPDVPGVLRCAVPLCLREQLLKEAHGGKFAGHFAERKIYKTLRKKYWWNGMHADVQKYCRACLECATRKGPGRGTRPPLNPIPIGGPFHRIGIDVLQLPLSFNGNQYALVMMDYFTKWPEVFAIPDQQASTIARFLVEQVITRHGVPEQLLSDRGANFLSELLLEVCKLMGIEKLNTSGYHPQTDGMVEKFNSTLIGMLSKCVEKHGRDWDVQLPYVMFAYRVAVHESTQESPFFLLYGRDARTPTETALTQCRTPYQVDLSDYRAEMVANLSDAWALAHSHIEESQSQQKRQYDKKSDEKARWRIGDRVMVHMPGTVKGKAWKLARAFYGPYRVISLTSEVRLVDKPQDSTIFVALERLRPCPGELKNVSWSGHTRKRTQRARKSQQVPVPSVPCRQQSYTGPVTRSRSRTQ